MTESGRDVRFGVEARDVQDEAGVGLLQLKKQAHGSTLMTQGLDILYHVDEANVRRSLSAFDELDAYAFEDPRKLKFGFDHLNNHGHHLADTRAGRIDALGSIGLNGQIRYEDLVEDAIASDFLYTAT